MSRVYNFSAGPSCLPEEVLRECAAEMLDYQGSGQSVMEMSHRSKVYKPIIEGAEAKIRNLMKVPDNYKILFLQGGGSTQFAMVAQNLAIRSGKAAYINTGVWSKKAIAEAKKLGIQFDLLVYSIASSVRTDPDTGVTYRSALKPFGKPFTGKTLDPFTGALTEITAEPATDEEAAATVKVMGGEDWQRWIEKLAAADLLAHGCITVAYSYIGPELSHAIYRDGAIGQAKKDLEQAGLDLDKEMNAALGGNAYVSINKGLVTRSSAVIPIISLYLSILFKVMKEKGTHEGCIEQMERLFAERLYTGADNSAGTVPVDSEHRIRIDDWELEPDVQKEVEKRMAAVTNENLAELGDLAGYKHDFLATNGFDVDGVDYTREVTKMDSLDF